MRKLERIETSTEHRGWAYFNMLGIPLNTLCNRYYFSPSHLMLCTNLDGMRLASPCTGQAANRPAPLRVISSGRTKSYCCSDISHKPMCSPYVFLPPYAIISNVENRVGVFALFGALRDRRSW